MNKDPDILNQIAFSLAAHYECVYYVDIATGRYIVFSSMLPMTGTDFPTSGDDFFSDATKNADVFIHPGDIEFMVKAYQKEELIAKVSRSGNYTISFRAVVDGKIHHKRHVLVMCKDKKHIVCCLEDVEEQFLEKEEQMKNLQSAELMARRDELTGVKNSTAFKEYVDSLDKRITSGEQDVELGIVMCDINDLKFINDTRGHNFGDEAIQATSRMICEIFGHSPVFRIGGDEFVIILTGNDYEHRDYLLQKLRDESDANRRSRSGPVVASGLAVFEDGDAKVSNVFGRADQLMYENKKALKSLKNLETIKGLEKEDTPIPDDRKRQLDAFFGALITVAGGGYIYLNDMHYDYSRWSLSLVDDFGMESEYMYHADKVWLQYIHPDDIGAYNSAINDVFCGDAELKPLKYRARKRDGSYAVLYTRGFVLSDSEGNPEYFGGIIIADE